jgi:dTMP kinase
MPAETELFLILGARAAFTQEVVRPALASGKVVLADRFDLSTFAYQGFGRGLDLARVREANAIATGGLKPDISLILDLPVEEGLGRKGGGQDGDRIEKEGVAFLSRVLEGYRTLAEQDDTVRLIPALGTPEEVQGLLRRALAEAFPETFSFDEV